MMSEAAKEQRGLMQYLANFYAQARACGPCFSQQFRKRFARTRALFLAAALLNLPAALADAGDSPHTAKNVDEPTVVILSGLQRGYPVPDAVIEGAYQQLRERNINFSNIFVEYLDVPRTGTTDSVKYKLMELRAKLAGRPIGAVITAEHAALKFALEENDPIFPDHVPVLTTLSTDADLASGPQRPLVRSFPGFAVGDTIDLGLRLFPETQRIFVIDGPAAQQRPIIPLAEAHIARMRSAPALENSLALSFEQMLERVSQLPPDTLVVLGNYFIDATGKRFIPAEVVKKVAAVANRPILGIYEAHVRNGLLGGVVVQPGEVGRHVGDIAYEVLIGKRQFKPGVSYDSAGHRVMFDWQQMSRWGISESQLPQDTLYLNRPKSLWETYNEAVIVFITAIVILSVLVIILAAQRVRRRKVESNLVDLTDELADMSTRYRLLFDAAPEAYFVMDASDGEILECNQGAEVMLRGSAAAIIGNTPVGLSPSHQADGSATADYVADRMKEIKKFGHASFEHLHRRFDGDVFWAGIEAKTGKLGERDVFFVTWRDISETKQLQREKDEALEEAIRVQELEKVNQQQSKLFAIIGHELRTPAAGIKMLLDKLDRGQSSPTVQQLIETTDHLLGVIDDMRVVTHPEEMVTGRVVFTAIGEVLEKSFELLTRLMQEKHVTLHYTPDDTAYTPCWVNAQLLRQIVLNIINNVALHSGASDLWVSVQGQQEDNGTVTFRLRFEDNGKGLPADMKGQIFEPFVRGEDTSPGLGLGLHIAHDYAREHLHGDLTYEDRPGGGAIFVLTTNLESSKREHKTIDHPASSIAGLRVLFAEDNELLRITTSGLLSELGAVVTAVDDGRQAEACVDNDTFDLIITDIFMPYVNGYELVRYCRDKGLTLPIIGVTAATVGGEIDRLIEAGADLGVAKPLDLQKINEIAGEFFPGRQTQTVQSTPTANTDVAEPMTEPATPTASSKTATESFHGTALVVDDNESDQLLTSIVLQGLGLYTEVAEDAQQALAYLAEKEFDIVFMDCQLPGMDGRAATQQIRDANSNVVNHAVAVVGLSGSAEAEDIEASLAAGMNAHVEKPLSLDKALETLNAHLPESAKSLALVNPVALVASYGTEETVQRLLNNYLSAGNKHLSAIAAALETPDTSLTAAELHKYKGTLMGLQAEEVLDPLRKVQAAVHEDDLVSANEHLSELKVMHEELCREITQYLEDHKR